MNPIPMLPKIESFQTVDEILDEIIKTKSVRQLSVTNEQILNIEKTSGNGQSTALIEGDPSDFKIKSVIIEEEDDSKGTDSCEAISSNKTVLTEKELRATKKRIKDRYYYLDMKANMSDEDLAILRNKQKEWQKQRMASLTPETKQKISISRAQRRKEKLNRMSTEEKNQMREKRRKRDQMKRFMSSFQAKST